MGCVEQSRSLFQEGTYKLCVWPIERRSPYVTLPQQQKFWMTTNRKGHLKVYSHYFKLPDLQFHLICQIFKKFSFRPYLSLSKLIKKKKATIFVCAHLLHKVGSSKQEVSYRSGATTANQKQYYHGNVTSHFSSLLRDTIKPLFCFPRISAHVSYEQRPFDLPFDFQNSLKPYIRKKSQLTGNYQKSRAKIEEPKNHYQRGLNFHYLKINFIKRFSLRLCLCCGSILCLV